MAAPAELAAFSDVRRIGEVSLAGALHVIAVGASSIGSGAGPLQGRFFFRLTPGTPCLLGFLFIPTGRNEIDCCDGFLQGDMSVTVAHLARRVPHDFLFDTIRHACDQTPRRKSVAKIMLMQVLYTSPLTSQGPGSPALPAFFRLRSL